MIKVVKNKWGRILRWGRKRLSFIFIGKYWLSGKRIRLTKMVTQKEWDEITEQAEDLHKNLKFD